MRFRTPANVLLRRAQLTLILAAMVPTALTAPVGIVLLARGGESSLAIVGGVLVVAFCASSLTGYILGSMLVARGATLARVQSDFLSSVSHELMTPITSVRLYIDTLRDDRVTDAAERRRCLDVLDREMHRLEALLQRLLGLVRVQSGRQVFERVPVAVGEIVDEALGSLATLRLGAPVELEVDLEPGLVVRGDRVQLAVALGNLLSNAWKYTPEKKWIRVRTRFWHGRVEIEVADNGPGIPPSQRKRIFEEFVRGDHAPRTPGAGLGLAIVRAIVKAHGGRVELETELGKGSRFRMILPREGR